MSTTSTYGLTHLAVAVRDLERTLNFYQVVFGMVVMYHTETMIQLTIPGCIDILVFEKNEAGLPGQQGGITHFGFRLRNPECGWIFLDGTKNGKR
ncbi:MAG: VOC family protein [Ferruginibacter sp.]